MGPMPKPIRMTPSSRQLARLVARSSLFAIAEETGIHYTQIWKYATGRSTPQAEQITKLHRATGGRVSALGWGS